MKHMKTDPACVLFRMPKTKWGYRWAARKVNRMRGFGCPVCIPVPQSHDSGSAS